MANTQTDNNRNVTQQGMTNTDKQNQQQKKAFEQGNGNNSTTADPKKDQDQKNSSQQQGLNSQDQSKITNKDPKITNKDESMKKGTQDQTATHDDEDVEENGTMNGRKNEDPEVDAPVRGTEKTEKKIPEMKK
jgi:hypothetical protein